jgi:putative inorganic carbon (HCO3(-)) transporter
LPKHIFGRAAELIASGEMLIVAAIAPALLFPTPTRLRSLFVVPLVWFCAWRTTGRAIPRTPLNVALGLMLAMVLVSLYATFDVRYSLGKVSGVILGVLCFWSVTRWITTRERLTLGVMAFVFAGSALAIAGLLGTSWFDRFPLLSAFIRRLPRVIRGMPGAEEGFQPNAVAGCLVLFVPLQLALLSVGTESWTRAGRSGTDRRIMLTVIQALFLTLTAGTLLLTQSRGAWVGLFVAALVFLAWHTRTTRALAAIAVSGCSVLAWTLGPGRLFNLAMSHSGPGIAADVPGRMELWSRGIYGIQNFPLTGMGMNTFRKVMPVLYPTFLTSPDFDVAHAHNHLLQAGLDLGIPGLVAYISIWMVASALLVAVYRRSKDRVYTIVAGGLGIGLIAHFVFSMTDAIGLGTKVGILFWLTLALVTALHHLALPPTVRT